VAARRCPEPAERLEDLPSDQEGKHASCDRQADVAQDGHGVEDVMEERGGLLAGVEQVAAERRAGRARRS
jgi:hypothetical protein